MSWLLARGKVERALELAITQQPLLRQHKLLEIVELAVDQLMQEGLAEPPLRVEVTAAASGRAPRPQAVDVPTR